MSDRQLRKIITIPLFKLIRLIKGLPNWLRWQIFCRFPRNPDRRDILFLSGNPTMAEYLSVAWELLKHDKRLRFYMYEHCGEKKRPDWGRVRSLLPIRKITGKWPFTRSWDLVLTSDHRGSGQKLVANNKWPAIFIPHGIASGKMIDGEPYAFGQYAFDEKGRMRYSRIFASSQANKDFAVARNTLFEDVVAVVGDPHTDRLLDVNGRRDEIRLELGFGPDDTVVFVLSTWGPTSLFNTIGDALLSESRKLMDSFKFILNVHPNEYRPQPYGLRIWGEYLRTQKQYGFVIREIDEDWMPYMAACDIIITDNTSLALHGTVLGRPFVYSPLGENVVDKKGLVWRLCEMSPRLNKDASNLRECLDQALNDYPVDKLRELAGDVNSYPGESAQRMREELYAVLKLPYEGDSLRTPVS